MSVRILHGDCLTVMADLIAEGVQVHAVVCDPPYGLEFMGKEWDGADGFRRSLNAADAGRDNAFGRLSRRGPEYRTVGTGQKNKPGIGERSLEWVSNQGWNQFRCAKCGHLFHGGSPCECAEPQPVRADNRWNLFQAWCESWSALALQILYPGGHLVAFGGTRTYHRLACAVEDAGFEIRDQIQWLYGQGFPKSKNIGEGRGTALKPAAEPIVLARKPLIGTVAQNVERYGVGALNIDACRVGDERREYDLKGGDNLNILSRIGAGDSPDAKGLGAYGVGAKQVSIGKATVIGRWPANVVHDGSQEVLDLFPDAPGQLADESLTAPSAKTRNVFGAMARSGEVSQDRRYTEKGATNFAALPGARRGDTGSAARFFYCAKASKAERDGSTHPTVKPLKLMRWLVRLVTPVGGTVLDPFAGTGTTGQAAEAEGMSAILIEREAQYVADMQRRLAVTGV